MKENRQGCLSRLVKPLFETFLKFQKVQQPVEKTFRQAAGGQLWPPGWVLQNRSLRLRITATTPMATPAMSRGTHQNCSSGRPVVMFIP